jgi:hypothetical protein
VAVGAMIEVHGTHRPDGSVDAARIEVKSSPVAGPDGGDARAELKGTIDALASAPGFVGDWTVSGKTVHVTEATRIDQEDGAVDLHALVEVKGTKRADGSIDARKIEVLLGPAGAGTALANVIFVPASARSQGRGGSFYTTELTISNTGTVDATVEVRFLGHGHDGRTGPLATLQIAAGASVTISDVLDELFGVASGYGALRISSNVTTLVVEAATSTPAADDGTFGQGHGGMGRDDLGREGRSRSIAGVRGDDDFRTNLAITNATERSLDVDVVLRSREGAELGRQRHHLEPLEMRQLDDAPHVLGGQGAITGARIVLSTPTPGGAFAALATLIDNRTNDPRVLSAR